MPSITFTVTAAEATRIQAAAAASGYPDAKSMIVAVVKQTVQLYEQNQASQQFAQGYTPVAPT